MPHSVIYRCIYGEKLDHKNCIKAHWLPNMNAEGAIVHKIIY